jgi:hypothetical protein
VSTDQPINRVRRRNRAVEDDQWIRSFLTGAQYGVVATESDGQPFLNPLLFAYDAEINTLYFHGTRAGRMFANIAANNRVCFNTCTMGRLLANPRAAGFDVEYQSVNVFGRLGVLDDAEEATRALRLLLEKYFPQLAYGKDYQSITPEQLARTAVYALRVEAWSGKKNPLDSPPAA